MSSTLAEYEIEFRAYSVLARTAKTSMRQKQPRWLSSFMFGWDRGWDIGWLSGALEAFLESLHAPSVLHSECPISAQDVEFLQEIHDRLVALITSWRGARMRRDSVVSLTAWTT
jgi:hypothetical protein